MSATLPRRIVKVSLGMEAREGEGRQALPKAVKDSRFFIYTYTRTHAHSTPNPTITLRRRHRDSYKNQVSLRVRLMCVQIASYQGSP